MPEPPSKNLKDFQGEFRIPHTDLSERICGQPQQGGGTGRFGSNRIATAVKHSEFRKGTAFALDAQELLSSV